MSYVLWGVTPVRLIRPFQKYFNGVKRVHSTHFVDKLWSRIVVDIFILTMEEEGIGRGGR